MNAHIKNYQARLNVTWQGENGDLADPVNFNDSDRELIAQATEALRFGSIPGIRADRTADLRDFMIDRFPASREIPYNRLFLRPKTPFG